MRLPQDFFKIKELTQCLQDLFSENQIEHIAKEVGFIKRKGKLNGFEFVLLCVFDNSQFKISSLNQHCLQLWHCGIKIKAQSLNERFNQSGVNLLKQVLNKLVSLQVQIPDILSNETSLFNRILITDSTTFQLPDRFKVVFKGFGGSSTASAMKIQYSYDLKSSQTVALDIHSGSQTDLVGNLPNIVKTDLILQDLGYYKISRFAKIHSAGGYFISRHKFSTTVYQQTDKGFQRLDLLKTIAKMRTGQIKSLSVWLGQQKEKFSVRLVLQKVPQKIADEKRRKLKQHKRGQVSKERLSFCDVAAFITNVPENMLTAQSVLKLYSLRWQIEIIFKCFKSIFDLNKVKPFKIQRLEAIIIGRLILAIMLTKLYGLFKIYFWNKKNLELSEYKSFKALRSILHSIKKNICYRTQDTYGLWKQINYIFGNHCLKQSRKSRLTPMMILSIIS